MPCEGSGPHPAEARPPRRLFFLGARGGRNGFDMLSGKSLQTWCQSHVTPLFEFNSQFE